MNATVARNDMIATNMFNKAIESYSNVCKIYSIEDKIEVINDEYSQYAKQLFGNNISDDKLYNLIKYSCKIIIEEYNGPLTMLKITTMIYDKIKKDC
jgi:hypothetical protein